MAARLRALTSILHTASTPTGQVNDRLVARNCHGKRKRKWNVPGYPGLCFVSSVSDWNYTEHLVVVKRSSIHELVYDCGCPGFVETGDTVSSAGSGPSRGKVAKL